MGLSPLIAMACGTTACQALLIGYGVLNYFLFAWLSFFLFCFALFAPKKHEKPSTTEQQPCLYGAVYRRNGDRIFHLCMAWKRALAYGPRNLAPHRKWNHQHD